MKQLHQKRKQKDSSELVKYLTTFLEEVGSPEKKTKRQCSDSHGTKNEVFH